MDTEYDVFLSHSSQDKPAVRQLAEALRNQGLKVWMDEWELRPGLPWQEAVERGIEHSRATLVIVGTEGFGPWEEPEMRAALEEQVRRKMPVIPVLLPGVADKDVKLPLFLRRNTWVVFSDSVDNAATLARLQWGITGENPSRKRGQEAVPAPAEDAPTDPIDEAVHNLAGRLATGNITFFLGKAASYGATGLPPSTCEIARSLLKSVGLIDADYDQLLPSIDVAAAYYAMKEGESSLEDHVIDMIMEHSTGIPPLYQALAELLVLLQRRPARRARRRLPTLIITTNFDVLLERALLRAGSSFSRLVQYRSAPQIDINQYADVQVLQNGSIRIGATQGSPIELDPDDQERMEDIIATHNLHHLKFHSGVVQDSTNAFGSLSLHDLTEPILYKFHGSQDVPNSCTISTDQYFDFVWRLLKDEVIPAQISELISNTPILFLDCRLLDPDFRLSYHTLLRKPLEIRTYRRFAVHARHEGERRDFNHQMELKSWEHIKNMALSRYGIEMLDQRGDVFLRRLRESVASELQRP